MSSLLAEITPDTPPVSSHLDNAEPEYDLLSAPERVPITRKMACFLADNGFLPGRYTLHEGTLYTDSRHIERISITRKMAYDLMDTNLIAGRWELIEGVILSKMGQKRPHANTLIRISNWLEDICGNKYVQSQLPIDITLADDETTEPEPDVAVSIQRIQDYEDGHPIPEHLLLVVEVADTTLRTDKVTKAKLYARAGIVEYWIADTKSRTITVHREPQNGKYQSVTNFAAEEEISCLAKPNEFKKVDELIAPMMTEMPQNTEQ